MDSRGPEPVDRVAGFDAARQQRTALGCPDRESRKVIGSSGIDARHLGRFAADQRTAGLAAPFRDPRYDCGRDLRIELSGGVIVEKEQGLGPLNDEIVHAHGHEVDSHGVVAARLVGDLDLGADAVVGRHQDRVGEARGLQVEESAEPTDLAIGPPVAASSGPSP